MTNLRLTMMLALALSAGAQTTIHGSLVGRIFDPQGLAVSAARVILDAEETGRRQTVISDNGGGYTFPIVEPGRYRVTVEHDGFHRAVETGIVVSLNQTADVDIALALGATEDSVTVASDGQMLQSQTTEVSLLVEGRQIHDLPLNGKNFQELLFLAPGTAFGSGSPNNAAISGSRASSNTYSIDGGTANDERTPNGMALTGGAAANGPGPNLISTEAIDQFRVIGSNADATFGRGSGGQINVITKSGTNDFHGSLYEFIRNDIFDARDFFNTGPFFDSQGDAINPPFRQNLFGATFGGRIKRNKHFFFANYEGYRQRLRETAANTVPNADLISLMPGSLGKLFRTFFIDRGIVPTAGNPAGQFSLLSAANRTAAINAGLKPNLFDGNLGNGEAGTIRLSTSPTFNVDQDSFVIRTDHRFTDRLSLTFRYAFAQPYVLDTADGLPIDFSETVQRWQAPAAQLTYIPSPSQVFEIRGTVERSASLSGPKGGLDPRLVAAGVSSQFGIVLSPGGTGITPLQLSNSGFLDNQTIPQISLLHSWTHGRWTLRSGFDIRRIQANVANVSSARPTYTFSGYVGATGILGANPSQQQAIAASVSTALFGANVGPTTPLRGWRDMQQEYFTQADWRVHKHVTLNLGLRYSYFGVYSEANGAISNLYATDSSGRMDTGASPFAFGRLSNTLTPIRGLRLYQPGWTNFQPRLGVAWDIGGRQRTVLRASYGIFFDRIYQIEFTSNVTNVPFAFATSAANVPFDPAAPVPLVTSSTPGITFVDPRLRDPLVQRFNVTADQRITKDLVVSAGYVGARASDLIRAEDPNGGAAVPQAARPDPRYSRERLVTNSASSHYDALQATVRQRTAAGLSFGAAYTYARSQDNSSSDFIFGVTPSLLNLGATAGPDFHGGGSQFVPRPASADWGNSDFDMRHNLAIHHLWDLPAGRGRRWLRTAGPALNAAIGGWSIAGILYRRSGAPVNVILGSDVNMDGDATTDRPALLKGGLGALYSHGGDRTQYLVPQDAANSLLGAPANLTDPFAPIARNSLRGPALTTYNVSLLKTFLIREMWSLRFEMNAFNVFNHANFDIPAADLSDPAFGQLVSTASGATPRQIQFGLKLSF